MSTNTAGDLCRLTVVTPRARADIAVPAHVPVAELLPAILRTGGERVPPGYEHGGWVLQRLGETPLDEDLPPAALGLRDGDVVHLRARHDALPAFDFDDLVDGVATGMRDRPDRWREGMTRKLFLGLMLAALVTGLAVLMQPGPALPRAITAGGVAVALLLAAGAASRSLGDSVAGTLLGCTALPYAVLCGMLAPGSFASDQWTAGPGVLAAGTGLGLVAVIALLLVGGSAPALIAAALVGVATALCGLLDVLTDLALGQAAAAVAVLALAFGPAVPTLAFRLAGMRLPVLPSDADELQEDDEPLASGPVLAGTARADRYITALFTVVGTVCAAAFTALAPTGGWAPAALIGTVSITLLLRSRVLVSGKQRLAAVLPGAYGIALLLIGLARMLPDGWGQPLVVGALLAATGFLLAAARRLPGRRLLPHWGRAADLLESLFAISTLPMLLAVLGVFAWARAIAG
ncbi:type VII secretion integral membrane protein EccD [Streptomyces sp. 8N616]|uniref:type VII secretion integral membrane protein EccD n=1 Tax=Streptomyces sp. 8N616 TaxID=3457414 RepID=UPI003FCFCBB0